MKYQKAARIEEQIAEAREQSSTCTNHHCANISIQELCHQLQEHAKRIRILENLVVEEASLLHEIVEQPEPIEFNRAPILQRSGWRFTILNRFFRHKYRTISSETNKNRSKKQHFFGKILLAVVIGLVSIVIMVMVM